MQINCDQCGATISRPPSRVKANKHQFCNKQCYDAFQVKRVDVSCSVCFTSMKVHPSKFRKNNNFACSPKCKAKLSRRNRIAFFSSADKRHVSCSYCDNQIERKPSQIQKYKTNFCNKECKNSWQKGKEKPNQSTGDFYPCENCKKLTWRTPATLKDHIFCSRECAQKVMPPPDNTGRSGPSGPDHYNWKGGHSSLDYTPGFTRMISRQIREHDNYTCQVCDKLQETKGEMVAHHIDFSKDNHTLENLITLCRTCHLKVHHQQTDLSYLRA